MHTYVYRLIDKLFETEINRNSLASTVVIEIHRAAKNTVIRKSEKDKEREKHLIVCAMIGVADS